MTTSVCFDPKNIKENLKSDADYKKQLQESFRRAFLSTLVSMIHIPRFNLQIVYEYASRVPVISRPKKMLGGTLGQGLGALQKGFGGLQKGPTNILKQGIPVDLPNGLTNGLGLQQNLLGSIDKRKQDAKNAFDTKVKDAALNADLADSLFPVVNATTNDVTGAIQNSIAQADPSAPKSDAKSELPSGIAELENMLTPSVLNAVFSTGLKIVGLGNSKKSLISAIDAGICEHIRRTKQGLVLWIKRNHNQIVKMMIDKHIGTLTKPETFDPKPPIKPVATECLDNEINEKLEDFNKQVFAIIDKFLDEFVAELVSYSQTEIVSRIQMSDRTFEPKKKISNEPESNEPEYVVPPMAEVLPFAPPINSIGLPVAQEVDIPSDITEPDTPPNRTTDEPLNQVQAMLKASIPFATSVDTALKTSQFFYLKEQILRRLKYIADTFTNTNAANYDKKPFENWCLEQFYKKLSAYDTKDRLVAYKKTPEEEADGGLLDGLFNGGRSKRRSKKRKQKQKRTAKRRTIRR